MQGVYRRRGRAVSALVHVNGRHEKAERCFVGGLEDSVNGNSVYKTVARSWADAESSVCNPHNCTWAAARGRRIERRGESEGNPALAAILHLAAFERFVFVMSTLEGYSDQECAILLDVHAER